MTDDDHPLAHIAAAEAVEPMTTAARLRAFEDKVLGENCARIAGNIERGVGSPFAGLSDQQKAHHAALEALAAAEQDHHDAVAAADAAADKLAAAQIRADETEGAL